LEEEGGGQKKKGGTSCQWEGSHATPPGERGITRRLRKKRRSECYLKEREKKKGLRGGQRPVFGCHEKGGRSVLGKREKGES